MKFSKIQKYTLCLFACLVAYKGGKRAFVFIKERFAPQSICIICKNIYSNELREEINDSVIRYLSGRSYSDVSLKELHKNLRQYFKLIKKTSWNWGDWGESKLVVEGVQPLFLVNDIFVLGEKRRLFPMVFFPDIPMQSLRPVKIDFSLCGIKVPRYVYDFLKKIPLDYWDEYSISYLGKERIILEGSSICFVVNENVMFDRIKIKRAENLYQDVLRRSSVGLSTMKSKRVVYDLRFDNRIYAKIIRRT